MKGQNDLLHKEIRELKMLENDFRLVGIELASVEREKEELRKKVDERIREEENTSQDEKELERRGLVAKIETLEDELKNERESARITIDKIQKENEQYKADLRKEKYGVMTAEREMQNARAERDDVKDKLILKKAKHKEKISLRDLEMKQGREELGIRENEKQGLEEEYDAVKSQLIESENKINDRNMEVEIYLSKIADLEQLIIELKNTLGEYEAKESEGLLTGADPAQLAQYKQKVYLYIYIYID